MSRRAHHAVGGALDLSFGIGGRVTTRLPVPSDDYGNSTAIDSHGRILVAGYTTNGSNIDFAVARLTPVGLPDTSFGGTGLVTFAFGPSDEYAYGMTVDSQDRVILAGDMHNGSSASVLAVARLTAAGTLDPSFDGDGKQTIDFGSSYDVAFGVAVDSLDRIVVAGAPGIGTDFEVARLTATGALDNSFAGDGKQTFSVGSYGEGEWGVAIDSQNRVVVCGGVVNGSSDDFAVARLTVGGALDGSFDGDGIQTIDFGGGANEVAYGVAIDSLDRVVVAGCTQTGSNSDFAVIRLTSAGALDSSFDGDGKQTIDFGSLSDCAYGVTIDSLDRIVVVGNTSNGSNKDFAIARLTSAGALDGSFDGDGKKTIALGSGDDQALAVAVDTLDRVVVAGNTGAAPARDFAVARLTLAGALDSTFDSDGKESLEFNAQSLAYGRSAAVDSQGRVVVAVQASNGLNYDFLVARYTSAGLLDTSFGGTGAVTFAFGTGDDVPMGIAVDSMDRVVVAGYTSLTGSNSAFAVARLTSAGLLDSSFDGDGKQTIAFGTSADQATSVTVDSLDRVVVAGFTTVGSTKHFAVVRLATAGALDSSFDGDGKQTVAFSAASDQANGVTVDSLDRIVLAGSMINGNYNDVAVARLTTAGALDLSFDSDGKQTIAFGPDEDVATGVAIDSLNRIVVGGYTRDHTTSAYSFAAARLTTAGALDTSFDGDGKQSIVFGSPGEDLAYGVAVDSHDRIVLAGSTFTNHDFAVARLTPAGSLDGSFDGDGKQVVDFGGRDTAYAVAIASSDRVVIAGLSINNGQLLTLARLTGDNLVATAQVNDGTAQRSRVTSLTVRFSDQVTFSGSPDQAFTLTRNGGGAVSFTATVSVLNGETVVTLDHFTGAETEFGSLADGRYTLTALASQISAGGQALDGDNDGVPGGNFVFGDAQGLFRLFGDVNGDRTVNGFDFGFFKDAFGTQVGNSYYLSYLDLNGDGVINGFDFGQFKLRFGTSLP